MLNFLFKLLISKEKAVKNMFSLETTTFLVNLENVQVFIDRYYVVKDIDSVKRSFLFCLFFYVELQKNSTIQTIKISNKRS